MSVYSHQSALFSLLLPWLICRESSIFLKLRISRPSLQDAWCLRKGPKFACDWLITKDFIFWISPFVVFIFIQTPHKHTKRSKSRLKTSLAVASINWSFLQRSIKRTHVELKPSITPKVELPTSHGGLRGSSHFRDIPQLIIEFQLFQSSLYIYQNMLYPNLHIGKPIYKAKYITFQKLTLFRENHENGSASSKQKSCSHRAIFALEVALYLAFMRTLFATHISAPFARGTPWNDYLAFHSHLNNSTTTKSLQEFIHAFCRQ